MLLFFPVHLLLLIMYLGIHFSLHSYSHPLLIFSILNMIKFHDYQNDTLIYIALCVQACIWGVLYTGLPSNAVVKNPPASAVDTKDTGSIPGLGRSPREGNGNLPQYSCLETCMDRGARWATIHGVARGRT